MVALKLNKGFTLVEVLLVVIIILVIAGLSLPNFAPTFLNFQLRETSSNLAYKMRYAQSRAITQSRTCRLEFSGDYSQYWLTEDTSEDDYASEKHFEKIAGRMGRTAKIPEGVRAESALNIIHFQEDGAIDPVRIYLCRKEQCFTISTQEQPGYVHIFDFRMDEG